MIKQWSVAVLVVALLAPGVAFAQPEGQQYRDPKACHELQAQGKITPWPTACEYVPAPVKAKKAKKEKDPPYFYRDFSPRLKLIGGITAGIGVLIMIPKGDTYHIFGDAVCVNGNSIDYGSCGSQLETEIGAVTAAVGLAMFAIGSVDVRIKPNVTSKQQKSVSVAFTW